MDNGWFFKKEIVWLFQGCIRFYISDLTAGLSIETDSLVLDLSLTD